MSEVMFSYYEVMGNSDQTEGKGRQVLKRAFDDEREAVAWADSDAGHRECGVMGMGPGEVVAVSIISTGTMRGEVKVERERVWGYRNAPWKDKWDYGYIDFRDAPTNDPDYDTYIRLKRKFG